MKSVPVLAMVIGIAAWPGQAPAQCWIRGTPSAADLAGRASPLDSIEARVADRVVKVCYGRPSARGRTMVGGVEPFDEPWRFGANEATSIHLPFAAEVAGVRVEPGSYSLYVIPGTTQWQIALNKVAQRWGVPLNSGVRAEDVGSGTVRPEPLEEHIEQMMLRFGPTSSTGTELIYEWERTRVRIPIRKAG